MNPLLGKQPSDSDVWLFKGAVVGVTWLLGEIDPERKKQWYQISAIFGIGGSGWNTYQLLRETP